MTITCRFSTPAAVASALTCTGVVTLIAAMTLLVGPEADAATLRVPGDFPTICEATAAAQFGDTVLVAAGVHEYQPRFCVPIRDGVVLTSEAGPELTKLFVWDWGPVAQLIRFQSGATSATEISGFTIECADIGGSAAPYGILCDGGSPRILRNILLPSHEYPCSLAETGIMCIGAASPLVMNNTILWIGDTEMCPGEVGRGIVCSNSSPMVINNIFYDVDRGIWCEQDSSPSVSCNDFWLVPDPYSGWPARCPAGVGDFFEDPLFCDLERGDFTLRQESPAVHGYGCGLVGAAPVGCEPTGVERQSWGRIKHLNH